MSTSASTDGQRRLVDEELPEYLVQLGLIPDSAGASVSSPGSGNLNYVRRVTRGGRSWIVKQARQGVEGFPEFQLGADRILFERAYDETVRALLPAGQVILPAVEAVDVCARVLVLEDLGPVDSLQDALLVGELPLAVLHTTGAFLGAVHAASGSRVAELAARFGNREMRELHGSSLFEAPWAAELPGLPERLRTLMREAGREARVRGRIATLRREYFSRTEALVHGDMKCANVLLTQSGPRLIDAEFAHLGDPAFDLGTALAHVHLCLDPRTAREVREEATGALLDGYRTTAALPDARFQRALGYAGVDIVAHVAGPSRLPFLREPQRATPILEMGITLLRGSA